MNLCILLSLSITSLSNPLCYVQMLKRSVGFANSKPKPQTHSLTHTPSSSHCSGHPAKIGIKPFGMRRIPLEGRGTRGKLRGRVFAGKCSQKSRHSQGRAQMKHCPTVSEKLSWCLPWTTPLSTIHHEQAAAAAKAGGGSLSLPFSPYSR